MTTWLLEKDIFENLDELKSEILAQGDQYIVGTRVPFTHTINLEKHLPDGPIFTYGSLHFIRSVALQTGGLEGYWERRKVHTMCNLFQFSCSYYYPRLSKYLLNQDHAFLPYGELIDKEEWVFNTFGIDDCVFMRPNSGFKEFTGQVYEKKYWKGMIELSNTDIQPEDLVVVARPRDIDFEYRVIVGPDGPITLCRTHKDRKLDADVEENCINAELIRDFINEVLEETNYSPDPFFTIDVGILAGRPYIVEVNSMSCSGYYRCDLSKIVKGVKGYFND